MVFSDQARGELGWSLDEAREILKGLGYAAIKRTDEATAWRRRAEREFALEHRPIIAPNSPFAALAALQGGLVLTQTRRSTEPLRTALDAMLAHIRASATRP